MDFGDFFTIGATVRICREIQCLQYAGIFHLEIVFTPRYKLDWVGSVKLHHFVKKKNIYICIYVYILHVLCDM